MATPAAVRRARGRRLSSAVRKNWAIDWFIRDYTDRLALTMRNRVNIATELVLSKIVQNISRPVTVTRGPRGGRVVTNRSKPGEYPKVETVQLLRTMFKVVVTPRKGMTEGRIGSPLFYAGILERSVKLDRNFAARTLKENYGTVMRILSGPIR